MRRFSAFVRVTFCLAIVFAAGCDGGGETTSGGAAPAPAPAPASSVAAAAAGRAAAPGSGGLTEDAVRQFVTRKEEKLATGVGSAHQSVRLEFVAVDLGQPRTPNEQDKIDGVRGDAVYPARVRYKSHRRWGNGDAEEKVIHYRYDFFRDPFGDWDAIGLGPVN